MSYNTNNKLQVAKDFSGAIAARITYIQLNGSKPIKDNIGIILNNKICDIYRIFKGKGLSPFELIFFRVILIYLNGLLENGLSGLQENNINKYNQNCSKIFDFEWNKIEYIKESIWYSISTKAIEYNYELDAILNDLDKLGLEKYKEEVKSYINIKKQEYANTTNTTKRANKSDAPTGFDIKTWLKKGYLKGSKTGNGWDYPGSDPRW